MNLFSREEFAARRRTSQTDLEDTLRPAVRHAVDLSEDTHGWDELLANVATLFSDLVYDESGDRGVPMPAKFREDVLKTLRKTTAPRDEHTVERITVWLATAMLSEATIQAAINDPEELFLEWVSMHDDAVRHAHRDADGQQRPVGEAFDVGGHKMRAPGDPTVPIELWINDRCTLRPVLASEAMSAALTMRLRGASHEEVALKYGIARDEIGAYMVREHAERPGIGGYPITDCASLKDAIQAIGRAKPEDRAKTIAHIKTQKQRLGCPEVTLPEDWSLVASANAVAEKSAVVVGLPAKDDPIHKVGDEQKHVTLAFLGKGVPEEKMAGVRDAVASYAKDVGQPFEASVSGHGTLGPDGAQVLFVEHPEIQQARDALTADPAVDLSADSHPHFVPHVTTHYGDDAHPDAASVGSIKFDRLAVWHGDQQDEYPLGDDMTTTPPEVEPTDAPADQAPEDNPEAAQIGVPWHAVFAPEGRWSGDKRMFAEGALTNRPLPLPLTWQKISAEGHDGNVTVAKTERIGKVKTPEGYEQRASGHFLMSPEADEVIGLIGEFGKFGLSVDADDSTFEIDEENEGVVFTSSRTCSACIVPIPAFHEAYIVLGEPPEDWFDGEADEAVAPTESLVASATLTELFSMPVLDIFKDLAPGKTEDGPGWLTHPVDTDRLRDYWVRGPGAAKIGWGTPGDFNRCRVEVGKYVKPQYLAGYCANRHFDALGFWPGRPVAGDTDQFAGEAMGVTEEAPSVSLVASVMHVSPAAWFSVPAPDHKVPITVTDDGAVFGFIATWDECHVGYAGDCVTPPHSATGYSYFLTGEAALDDGSRIPVGQLTIGGGHAADGVNMRAALEHYDSTSTAWADVTVTENEIGIWCCGRVRPGTSKDMVTAAMASPASGDWREVTPGQMEMIAALSVNVQGFRVPRVHVAASNGRIVSLVAAGAVPQPVEKQHSDEETARLAASLVDLVEAELAAREQRRQRMAALRAKRTVNA